MDDFRRHFKEPLVIEILFVTARLRSGLFIGAREERFAAHVGVCCITCGRTLDEGLKYAGDTIREAIDSHVTRVPFFDAHTGTVRSLTEEEIVDEFSFKLSGDFLADILAAAANLSCNRYNSHDAPCPPRILPRAPSFSERPYHATLCRFRANEETRPTGQTIRQ